LDLPNSGFAHETMWAQPNSDQLQKDWQPNFDVLINAFGTARCMFESNFPVDKVHQFVECPQADQWSTGNVRHRV